MKKTVASIVTWFLLWGGAALQAQVSETQTFTNLNKAVENIEWASKSIEEILRVVA